MTVRDLRPTSGLRHLAPAVPATAVTLCLCLWPLPARAEHGNPVLVVAPRSGQTIPRNGWIRLQSYNGVSWYVERLRDAKNPAQAELVSGGHRVGMKIKDWYDDDEGGYGRSILTLAPKKLLKAAQTYKLVMTDRHPKAGVKTYTLGSWKVSGRIDSGAPRWRGKPSVAPRKTTYYGVEPSVIISLKDEDLLEVVAELQPVRRGLGKGGKAKRLIIVFDKSRWCPQGATASYPVAIVRSNCPTPGKPTEICHRMAVWQTSKDVGKRYRIRLKARDLAGNERRAPGGTLPYTWRKSQHLRVCWKKP